jgi:hypothetical protein
MYELVLPDLFSENLTHFFVFYNGIILTPPRDYEIFKCVSSALFGSPPSGTKKVLKFKIKMSKGCIINLYDNGNNIHLIYEFNGKNFTVQSTCIKVNIMSSTKHKMNSNSDIMPKSRIFSLPWSDPFAANSEPEPKNNDGRDRCFWCNVATKRIEGFSNVYNICPKCGK